MQLDNNIRPDRYHTFWNRFFALIIDGLVLKPLDWLDSSIVNSAASSESIMLWGVFYSLAVVFYYIVMHANFGKTIGKMITGITVLDVSEKRTVSFYQACLRDIVPIILIPISIHIYYQIAYFGATLESLSDEPWFALLGFGLIAWGLLEIVSMLLNDKRRAVHDLLAGSVVVKGGSL